MVGSYLERRGYRVLQADTAVRGLELAPSADLIVLDLRLPDRSGEEPAERAIDAHVKNLRRKLGDRGTVDHLIVTVPGVGYKLAVERDA
ncbi:DNA-binding response regulator [Haloechinothrix sp. LS1_15]|uniref:DNA-binding response regulator n=1 Tax=Haloechinothrix sp. LS1_15 TaxID=2652248 RepID=UPI00294AACC2|nr:DNA-binding response regulator [Haloechinothrix sp. LS1_15]